VQGLTPSGARHVVHAIASLVNATDIRQTEQGLEQQRLIDPLPEESALPALREHVLADPALVDHVVSADGRMATIVLRTDFMSEADAAVVYDALQRILRESETDTFTLRLTGMAALEVALNRTMERDVTVVVSICLVAMLAILFFIFRGPFGVLGPLLVVVQAVVWTLGAMALAGAPMTGVTSVLASFLICVGMADSIHVQSVFRDLRRDGASARDAVVQALAVTGVPVLMTSLTTIAGLLSFRTASLSAVIDMGTYGAFGVAAALVLSLVFLPAFLTFHRGSGLGARAVAPQAGGAPHVPDMLDRILARCDATSRPVVVDGQRRYGRRNLTLFVSLLIAAGVGVRSHAPRGAARPAQLAAARPRSAHLARGRGPRHGRHRHRAHAHLRPPRADAQAPRRDEPPRAARGARARVRGPGARGAACGHERHQRAQRAAPGPARARARG
jgi:hypothetical protein